MKNKVLKFTAAVLFAAAGSADDPVTFTMRAYTGVPMWVGLDRAVVFDLAGAEITAKARPILRDHMTSQIVGHTTDIVVGERDLDIAGQVSGENEYAAEVARSSKKGFPWQASIGAQVMGSDLRKVEKGQWVEVNGQRFKGPIYVAQKWKLVEVSFVALGADDDTSALVAALNTGESGMDEFAKWVKAKGFDPEALTEGQRESLRAMFDSEQADPEGDKGAKPTSTTASASPESSPGDDPVQAMRMQAAAESTRISEIRKLTAGHADIEAKAIAEGWDATKAELEVLRASRPAVGAPAIHVGATTTANVIEAAVCLTAGLADAKLLKDYGEKTLDAASKMQGLGLRETIGLCARLEGKSLPPVFGDGRQFMQAGFSTTSFPAVMENVMNKTMLDAYESQDIVAFELCDIGSVSDFKEVSRIRLHGTGRFGRVGPQGELPNGVATDEKFTNKAETHGQMFMLTRQDVINDDVNALLSIPRLMGIEGASTINDLFFRLLLANTGNFMSANNGNFLTGGTFAADQLKALHTLFRKAKSGPKSGRARDQRSISIRPEILLVPVELEWEAKQLIGSATLANSEQPGSPVQNPLYNQYKKVLSAPQLSDDFYTGNSASAFYLFADPAKLAAFEIVFLNGRRRPVIERVEAPANTLGMGFRGYIDVGVSQMDKRAAAKHDGIAASSGS